MVEELSGCMTCKLNCVTYFWYDTDALDFFFLKSWRHTKRRMSAATRAHPSSGMTITQSIIFVIDPGV